MPSKVPGGTGCPRFDGTRRIMSTRAVTIKGALVASLILFGLAGCGGVGAEDSGSEVGAEAASDPATKSTGSEFDQVAQATVALSTPTKFVVIVWDGSSNTGDIMDAFDAAVDNVSGWTAYKGSHVGGTTDVSTVKNKIDDAVDKFDLPKSSLSALIVGKSLGGAKTYKLLASNASFFDDFHRTAVTI